MHPTSSPFPSPEEGLSLHLRHCASDAVASSDLCDAYLRPLVRALEPGFRQIDPHLREEAAGQALFNYLKAPHTYNPARSDLAAFLRLAARGDLLNLIESEERHRHLSLSVVELDAEGRNIPGREEDPADAAERREETERQQAVLRSIEESCTEPERRVLHLMLAGERANQVFAEAVGVTDLPLEEQEHQVKLVKDRLKKRLERGGAKHD